MMHEVHPLGELIIEMNKCERFNRWFTFPEFKLVAYIRITERYINGEKYKAIDMANVEVQEAYQKQGYFTKFINELELLAKRSRRLVYVESIQHEYLYDSLLRRGYQEVDSSNQYMNFNLFKKV